MWRFLVIVASVPAIPMVCDPPADPPPYECRALPEQLDFGEVQSFTKKTLFIRLDNRDRPDLVGLAEPFAARLTSQRELVIAVEFTPLDAKLHLEDLRVRLSPECEEQTVRLTGLGSGALETTTDKLDFGETPRTQPTELVVPLTNTRRAPISVSGFSSGPNRIDIEPSVFVLQPAERREVTVRLTCLRDGPVTDSLEFRANDFSLGFSVNGECLQ